MIADDAAVVYAEWESTIEEITSSARHHAVRILVLGATDVGKTTFARLLVNRLVALGQRVGIVDADLGQSEIGPPACIGLAFAEAPIQSLSELTPHALAFVGGTSPPNFLLEHAGGVRRLADMVTRDSLVIDTSGYLHGPSARRLNHVEFDLIQPTHVVGLQRDVELESILAPMRRRDSCNVHTPKVPAVICKKPTVYRTQRRALRFAAYFAGSNQHSYSFSEVAIVGSWFNGGPPVAAHLLRFLNQSLGNGVRVFYAEMSGRHLGLMVNQPVPTDSPGIGIALQQLRAQSVSITAAPRLKHLLLGLEGGNGKLLGLGLLEAIDFRRTNSGTRSRRGTRPPFRQHPYRAGWLGSWFAATKRNITRGVKLAYTAKKVVESACVDPLPSSAEVLVGFTAPAASA